MPTSSIRKSLLALTALAFTVLLAGCSTMSVTFDYDKNVTWEKYRTYGWLGGNDPAPTDATKAQLSGGLLEKRIHEAVNYEMGQRGITMADNPDLLVKYFLGTEDKVQVTDWGYRYSDYYWGYGGRQIDVYQFTEGTLILDIIDAESKTLIWRGTATGTVEGQQRTPEEMQERVNNVVHKILENFPPR